MSTPESFPPNPSGSFVPPGGSYTPAGQPPRRRQGCWLWGFLTCLTVVLIFAALMAIVGYKALKSGIGKQIVGQAYKAQDCTQKMMLVRDAINRYHEHTGQYPPNLAALAPTYIDAANLHCELDKNPSATHPSFAYKRPPTGTSENSATPVLSFHYDLKVPYSGMRQDTDAETIMCLNGSVLQNETSTVHDPNGRVYRSHSGSSVTLGPGSTGQPL